MEVSITPRLIGTESINKTTFLSLIESHNSPPTEKTTQEKPQKSERTKHARETLAQVIHISKRELRRGIFISLLFHIKNPITSCRNEKECYFEENQEFNHLRRLSSWSHPSNGSQTKNLLSSPRGAANHIK
jgi:hypothetical protein